jgi:hypothetical protein
VVVISFPIWPYDEFDLDGIEFAWAEQKPNKQTAKAATLLSIIPLIIYAPLTSACAERRMIVGFYGLVKYLFISRLS